MTRFLTMDSTDTELQMVRLMRLMQKDEPEVVRQYVRQYRDTLPVHKRFLAVEAFIDQYGCNDDEEASLRLKLQQMVSEPQNPYEAHWLALVRDPALPRPAPESLVQASDDHCQGYLELYNFHAMSEEDFRHLVSCLARADATGSRINHALRQAVIERDDLIAFRQIAALKHEDNSADHIFFRATEKRSAINREIILNWPFNDPLNNIYKGAAPALLERCSASELSTHVSVCQYYLANELWPPAAIAAHCKVALAMTLVAKYHPSPMDVFSLLPAELQSLGMDAVFGEHVEVDDFLPF